MLNLKKPKTTNVSILIFIFFFSFSISLNAQKTFLQCGKILNVSKGNYIKNATIIIEKGKIVEIKKGFVGGETDASIVDLKQAYVLPGLIDMHVHLEHETNKNQRLDIFTKSLSDIALKSTVFAKKTLMAGFTTVRDLGGTGVNISLRNAINKGYVIGPRIFTSGKAIATTGGHADPTNGYRKDLMGDPSPKYGVINGASDAKKAVRQRYKNGADWIKIMATGGVLSIAKNGQNPQFDMEELKAIINTANDYEMFVAAHAHGDEGMRRAVEAGVKTIEHGTYMSEKTMDLMMKKDAYYVPTISAGEFVGKFAKVEGYYHPLVVPKARAIGPQIKSTFEKAYKKGVKIAFGTDAGVFPHGENAKEFAYMVQAGMSNIEALQSATITNAMLLGHGDDLGLIKADYIADIIATEKDPLKDIYTLENIIFVMKEGVVYKSK